MRNKVLRFHKIAILKIDEDSNEKEQLFKRTIKNKSYRVI